MKATKQENDTIMRFITHYDLQNDTNKKVLRVAFLEKTGLGQNTFYYKLRNKNYKRTEIEVLSGILEQVKKTKNAPTKKF